MNIKTVALIFAIIVYFSYDWYSGVISSSVQKKKQASSSSLPDYYVTDFYILGADEKGNPKYRLSAKRLEHIAEDDHADLIEPKMKFYPEDSSAPWFVSAQTGRIDQRSEVITLYGKVTIVRKASELNLPVSIETKDISFFTKTNLVKTNSKVVFTSRENFVRGTGLEADLSKQVISLKKNAKAKYIPEASQGKKPK